MFKLMGSTYFFNMYPDFKSKDTDWWELVDELPDYKYMCRIASVSVPKREYFSFKRLSNKEDHIKAALDSKLSMVVGKFLVAEFCDEIGFTIEDLPKLKPLIDNLDEAHKYEEIIYNSYLENNSFSLTQEQRDLAYKSYKESRNLT